MLTPNWITRDAGEAFARQVGALAAMMPRIKRVRRRGFGADVCRGSSVQYAGEKWEVVRRSAWNLWLAKYEPPLRVGDTIRISLPTRFEMIQTRKEK